jgi:decaprenylphospho-beta-D-ribofuranose 2-oxidase
MRTEVLTGWGRTPRASSRRLAMQDESHVAQAILDAGARGLLPRGAGRSYGDAAVNSGGVVLDVAALNSVRVDADAVTVGAGTRLHDLIDDLLPYGLLPPVLPGTSRVTMAGLVATDAHGKNHHQVGSWGSHLERIRLVDGLGSAHDLRPTGPDAELFWATVGGMGLTGVITEFTFRALRVPSSDMAVTTTRHDDLTSVMHALTAADATAPYSVAWIDSVGLTGRRGRGIVTQAEHVPRSADPSRQRPPPHVTVPVRPPVNLLGRASVGTFNELWLRLAGRPRVAHRQSLWSYFFPLDRIDNWNVLYGPRGFVQYQVAVPDHASDVIATILERLSAIRSPSFLSVLKRFGTANAAPMSFPMPGWTLAVDLPVGNHRLPSVLTWLDGLVLEAGGRHYLAKDARMTAAALAAGYPRLDEWRRVRDRLDPLGVFNSDLARRLGMAPGTPR